MDRRRFLWGVGFVLPLVVLFVWVRAIASWRPVAVGQLGCESPSELIVSQNRVSYAGQDGKGRRVNGWFDIQKAEMQTSSSTPRKTGSDGACSWVLWMGDDNTPYTLEVMDGRGKKRIFAGHTVANPQRGELSVRILPAQNRVILLKSQKIFEWNFTTQRLVSIHSIEGALPQALSRDGRIFIASVGDHFEIGDTRSGKTLKTIMWRTTPPLEFNYLSPYGRYSVFDQRNGTMKVVDTVTGKALWSFPVASLWSGDWTISDDEKTLFVSNTKEWQMRELKTGALLRRLPLAPGTSSGASSPDGATIYSVAKGVLYRQRVR